MRTAILGGTRFIGAATVEACLDAGDDVLVIHRGQSEADDLPEVEHAHLERTDAAALRSVLDRFDPDAVVDTCCFNTEQARTAGEAFGDRHHVTLSSQDVYRAFATINRGGPAVDGLPLDEDSPVRTGDQRYLYRGLPAPPSRSAIDHDTYEKLDVEPVVTDAGGCVLRLPMVYGERDAQFREGPVLRRLAAGRARIPVGPGTWLWTRVYVRDVAAAIRTAAAQPEATSGRIFNVGERRTLQIGQWFRHIAALVGTDVEFVLVDDAVLPEDLGLTATMPQHVLVDSHRFREATGWTDRDPMEALRASVAWHLDRHEPDPHADWTADDEALATIERASSPG